MTECIRRSAAGVALLLLSLSGAAAQTLHVVESRISTDGPNAQYVIRFDSPVDHERSRLVIKQGDRIRYTLRPVLRAEPNVLAATTAHLPAGTYELRWSARSLPSGDVTEGSIPFMVR